MENNDRDFLKNHPQVANANQAKDVYGPMKKSSIAVITVLLSIIMIVCSVACFLRGRVLSGVLFLVLFIILVISSIVASISDRANAKPEKHEHPDAIFKDHEE